MAVKKPTPKKKYYTTAEANATLPLVCAIVRDISELARDLKDRYERLTRLLPSGRVLAGDSWSEEVQHMARRL